MNQSNAYLKILCYGVLILFPALAWFGGLDTASDQHLDAGLAAAGAIYATARGINALVSVLQGTELDVVFVTFTIGEILDPLNDLIERFSSVVLFAIGAIAAQKVLLALVSHNIFNYLLTAIAILTAGAYAYRQSHLLQPLAKVFIIAVFVRFALGIVVITNHFVDTAFLQNEDQQRHQGMKAFQQELRSVEQAVSQGEDYTQQLAQLRQQQQVLQAQVQEQNSLRSELQQQILAADQEIDELQQGSDWSCRFSPLSPTCPGSIKQVLQQRRALILQRQRIDEALDVLRGEIATSQKNIDCVSKRSRGEGCSIWDSLPDAPNLAELRDKLDSLEDQLTDFTTNAWMLLMSLLIKSVLIPIVFLYGMLKIARSVWRLDLG